MTRTCPRCGSNQIGRYSGVCIRCHRSDSLMAAVADSERRVRLTKSCRGCGAPVWSFDLCPACYAKRKAVTK